MTNSFDINTKGAYFTIQKALPFLNDGASIILNTSVAGESGVVNGTVYAATKAAMRSFTRSIAAELVGARHPPRERGEPWTHQ